MFVFKHLFRTTHSEKTYVRTYACCLPPSYLLFGLMCLPPHQNNQKKKSCQILYRLYADNNNKLIAFKLLLKLLLLPNRKAIKSNLCIRIQLFCVYKYITSYILTIEVLHKIVKKKNVNVLMYTWRRRRRSMRGMRKVNICVCARLDLC